MPIIEWEKWHRKREIERERERERECGGRDERIKVNRLLECRDRELCPLPGFLLARTHARICICATAIRLLAGPPIQLVSQPAGRSPTVWPTCRLVGQLASCCLLARLPACVHQTAGAITGRPRFGPVRLERHTQTNRCMRK